MDEIEQLRGLFPIIGFEFGMDGNRWDWMGWVYIVGGGWISGIMDVCSIGCQIGSGQTDGMG